MAIINKKRGREMEGRGFTLVELLVVLAIVGILLTIAMPGYSFLVNSNRLAVVTNELVTTLHLARSEAIKRSKRVTVCITSSASNPIPACDASASWQHGWLLFVDGGTAGVIESSDTLLGVYNSVSEAVAITTSNYNNYVSYLPSGQSQGPNGLPNGAIRVCVDSNRRDIIINNAGRIRLASHTC